MTREEASFILANIERRGCDNELNEARDMAIRELDQEPCDDAISRQAVLDAITANCILENEYNLTSSRIKKAVESLPPVNPQPKTEWIPVSKRLPELNKPLLVTTYHRVYYGHLISESGNYGYPVFRIHGLGDKNRDWVQETMSHEPYSLGRIDAWMYLDIPEPYKVSEIPTGSEPQESEDKE